MPEVDLVLETEEGDTTMPMDLPDGVGQLMMTESAANMQANNRDGRNVGTQAMGVLQAAMAQNFQELGSIESRANSGILATPIAAPTTGGASA